MNEYALETLVRERLAGARAAARRRALVPRREPPSLRARLGRTLIALGHRLLGAHGAAVVAASAETTRA